MVSAYLTPFSRAVGTLATLLGNSSVADLMLNRSKNYRNVWSHKEQFMCERQRSGDFKCPTDPYLNTWIIKSQGYTEGVFAAVATHAQ